ncbi:MAG: acyl-CoA desaturase [Phycisphaerales bacterium]|nr:acyl-CoA desaturase [Phycisphaerales bacterium]MCB9862138.1 acyl-CoA desaturase [Phycisphaerales bacterium]
MRVFKSMALWFDSGVTTEPVPKEEFWIIEWTRIVPLIIMHLAVIGVIWVGWSPVAVSVAVAMYFIRMFAITGIYHRYFSHRAFKTSRFMQFVFALLGASAVQRGPLWWAAHHRHHHRHSDEEEDVHSPHQHGFWWSHIGWITTRGAFPTDYKAIPDLVKFKELRFLDRADLLIPVLLAIGMFLFGVVLNAIWPALGTGGFQMLVWGFFISTVCLLHGTCTINSLAHLIGRRRYETTDDSRNSFLLALITMGEGWHNNHHMYPGVTRQGFYWWEIDVTYYILKSMSIVGLIWDLRPPPKAAFESAEAPAAAAPAEPPAIDLPSRVQPNAVA